MWLGTHARRIGATDSGSPPVQLLVSVGDGVSDHDEHTPATAPAPRGTSHSLAVNSHKNHVFLPLPANNVFPSCLNGCIGVFGAPAGDDD